MSKQLRLDEWQPRGATIDLDRDKPRLSRQMQLVWNCLSIDPWQWRTLRQISDFTGAPEASVSARLRDLRHLGYTIERRYVERGLHLYRMVKP